MEVIKIKGTPHSGKTNRLLEMFMNEVFIDAPIKNMLLTCEETHETIFKRFRTKCEDNGHVVTEVKNTTSIMDIAVDGKDKLLKYLKEIDEPMNIFIDMPMLLANMTLDELGAIDNNNIRCLMYTLSLPITKDSFDKDKKVKKELIIE